MKIPLVAAAFGCCGVLAVAGCGGDDNEKSSSAPATNAAPAQTQTQATPAPSGGKKTATVDESEFKLAPKTLNVGAGAVTITAKNVGQTQHDLEVEGKGVEKKTALLQPGSSGTLKVDLKPGTYEMYCTVPGHKEAGMEGKVVVK